MEHFQLGKTSHRHIFILFCFVSSLRRSFRLICGIEFSSSLSLWFICRFSLGYPEMAFFLPPIKWSWIGRSVGRTVGCENRTFYLSMCATSNILLENRLKWPSNRSVHYFHRRALDVRSISLCRWCVDVLCILLVYIFILFVFVVFW